MFSENLVNVNNYTLVEGVHKQVIYMYVSNQTELEWEWVGERSDYNSLTT